MCMRSSHPLEISDRVPTCTPELWQDSLWTVHRGRAGCKPVTPKRLFLSSPTNARTPCGWVLVGRRWLNNKGKGATPCFLTKTSTILFWATVKSLDNSNRPAVPENSDWTFGSSHRDRHLSILGYHCSGLEKGNKCECFISFREAKLNSKTTEGKKDKQEDRWGLRGHEDKAEWETLSCPQAIGFALRLNIGQAHPSHCNFAVDDR